MYFNTVRPFFTTSFYEKLIGKFDFFTNEHVISSFENLTKIITNPQLYQQQKIRRNVHMMIIYTFKIIYESQLASDKHLVNCEELFLPMILESCSIEDEYIQTITRQIIIEMCYYNPSTKMINLLMVEE